MFRPILIGVAQLVLFVTAACLPGFGAESQERLSGRLRHEYAQIRDMECVYDHVALPTDATVVPLVHRLYQASPHLQALGKVQDCIFTVENAAAQSRRCHWYRKGSMERLSVFELTENVRTGIPRTTYAFDGQIKRQVNYKDIDGKRRGSVATADSADWRRIHRDNPWGFLFSYREIPYWKLVKEAAEFRGEDVQRDGTVVHRYTFRAPKLLRYKFVLLFDALGRLLEREVWYDILNGPEEIQQRFLFGEYRAHPLRSGETLHFPHRVTKEGILGRLHDDRVVVTNVTNFKILEIQFNQDIPDNLFELEIPPDVEVWDGINHTGWIAPGAPLPKPPSNRTWPRYVVIGSAVLLALSLFGWAAWRRRRIAA